MKYSRGYGLLAVAINMVANVAQTSARQQQPLNVDSSILSLPSSLDESLDVFVEQVMETLRVPGLSLAVIDGGDITSKGYGIAEFPDTKADADTRYFAGSTTKAFLATYMAMMVQDDDQYPNVKWTSPINSLIREDFVLGDEHLTSHTTIEDALSHRTGLPAHDLSYGQTGDTISKVVQRARFLPLTFEPRTVFQYCNIGYGIVTDIVERLTGLKLETTLKENIWEPLGMRSTSFEAPWLAEDQSVPTHSSSKLARGYYWDPLNMSQPYNNGRYLPEKWYDITPVSGAGCIVSSVNDYTLWMKALLDAFKRHGNDSSPITPSIFDDIVTARTVVPLMKGVQDGTPPLYALGWVVSELLGTTVISHSGGLPGFGTCVYLFPFLDFGIVTMGNTAATSIIAGATVASKLILEKIGITGEAKGQSEYENTLVRYSHRLHALSEGAFLQEMKSFTDAVQDSNSLFHTASLPLPGKIEDFAGIYSHPAYGEFNLSVFSAKSQSESKQEISLRGLLYPRTISTRLDLVHVTDTVFSLKVSVPHGTGDITSDSPSNDLVWVPMFEKMQAVFEFGLDGKSVETLGLELDLSMVKAARETGGKAWRDGMIWFDRV